MKRLIAMTVVGMLAAGQAALAQTPLKVIVFPSVSNLGLLAAQHNGIFAKHGLAVEIINTPNSDELRDGLAAGRYQIAHAAVDNLVAMVELAKADAVIVTGGDSGFNNLYVQPEIKSYADLRGKTVVVDAPNTAYALLLYKMLKDNGVVKGEYTIKPVGGTQQRLATMQQDKANAAAMLNPPFSFRAEQAGLKSLGSAAVAVGAYQAGGAFVMRGWAQANADTLVRYIRAYVEGLRWAMNPANRTETTALFAERLKLPSDIAQKSYDLMVHPANGLAIEAKFDAAGFRNVLKLRAEIEGQWGGNPPPPDKYLDLTYYDKALAGL